MDLLARRRRPFGSAQQFEVRELFTALPRENVGYAMTYHDGCTAVARISLFRNHPEIRWSYRVHEQIFPAIERQGGRVAVTDIILHTVGYQDPCAVHCKLQRNLRLLQLEINDRPGDPLTKWNLGRTTLRLGLFQEAAHWLQHRLARVGTDSPTYLALAYGQLAEALCCLKRFPEARECCRAGRARFPNDLPLTLAEGVVLAELGEPRRRNFAWRRWCAATGPITWPRFGWRGCGRRGGLR